MVSLEPMRWWHIEEILPIEDELFGAERWSAAMFWNELANGHYYLVAIDDGRLVGYAGLQLPTAPRARPLPNPPDEAWVQNVGVRTSAQRRGIGRALLEALLAEAERQKAGKVLLEVAVDNGPAQKLYARYGFESVGIRRGYYQPSNTDALVMLREQ
jgi:ribosomal-protein-alanine N-acetyltransferase